MSTGSSSTPHFRDYRADDVTTAGDGAVGQCSVGQVRRQVRAQTSSEPVGRGRQPLAQRLHDKPPIWGPDGLTPHPRGHRSRADRPSLHLPRHDRRRRRHHRPGRPAVVRSYAQCAALFPLMQFSMAPWRVLTDLTSPPYRLPSIPPEARTEIPARRVRAASGEPILRPARVHLSA